MVEVLVVRREVIVVTRLDVRLTIITKIRRDVMRSMELVPVQIVKAKKNI